MLILNGSIILSLFLIILRIFLQNCKCIFFNTCTFSYPQTSHPYVRMGSMRVSNSLSNKTKVVIFCKRKSRHIQSFKLFGHALDIVDSYSYLGVTFNYTGTFLKDKKLKSEQAQKALFSL
jgi:hypothetical protein